MEHLDVNETNQKDLGPRPRRPRGFAATSALDSGSASGSRREREKEKERTKLRERHRRAITSRILSGLRQHGNFPLPARADMNDVLAALARDAGWTVEPNGTTYRATPPVSQSTGTAEAGQNTIPLTASSSGGVIDGKDDIIEIDTPKYPYNGNAFPGTPRVPVYVTLSPVFINKFCELINTQLLREELCHLKSLKIDGVAVECYWGIVEAWNPQKYNWTGYRELFAFLKEFSFSLQIILSFHEHDSILLPHWVSTLGKENPDIFFTDHHQTRNTECLSWSVDKERVLRGRTAVEVYFDFMRSFRTEFDDMFTGHVIESVEIGLGPSGELRYPSCSFPGIGEFQCYDKYFLRILQDEAKSQGKINWGRVPDNAGNYTSRPDETGFFCEKGDYDTYYGRFFLRWYTQSLINHAERVLSLAALTFHDSKLVVKIPAVYWWYKTGSHAAELTAGYYNCLNNNGYSAVFKMLRKYSAAVKVVCGGVSGGDAHADSEGLWWQMVNSAWDEGLDVGGVNGVCCYERKDYKRMVETIKMRSHVDDRRFSFFVYRQPSPLCQGATCVADVVHFVHSLHGELPDHHLLV